MTKLLQQCFLFFIVVVIPGHNLGNSQVSVNRTIGPTLVFIIYCQFSFSDFFQCSAGDILLHISSENVYKHVTQVDLYVYKHTGKTMDLRSL